MPLLCFICSEQENHKLRTSKSAVVPRRRTGGTGGVEAARQTRKGPLRATASVDVKVKSAQEEETYRVQMDS